LSAGLKEHRPVQVTKGEFTKAGNAVSNKEGALDKNVVGLPSMSSSSGKNVQKRDVFDVEMMREVLRAQQTVRSKKSGQNSNNALDTDMMLEILHKQESLRSLLKASKEKGDGWT
jgi:hypothetical protein